MNQVVKSNLPKAIESRGISQEVYEGMLMLYPGQTPETLSMIHSYCKARGLDVMRKPVHAIKYGNQIQFVPAINLDRTTAHRTKEYAGQDEAVFGDELTKEYNWKKQDYNTKKWSEGLVTVTYPKFCKVTVYRMVHGHRCAFTATVRWDEMYARLNAHADAPNPTWQQRPFGMMEKCAEAAALRKAFPEEFGGEYDAAEFGTQMTDIEHVPMTSKGQGRLDAFIPKEAATPEDFADSTPQDIPAGQDQVVIDVTPIVDDTPGIIPEADIVIEPSMEDHLNGFRDEITFKLANNEFKTGDELEAYIKEAGDKGILDYYGKEYPTKFANFCKKMAAEKETLTPTTEGQDNG